MKTRTTACILANVVFLTATVSATASVYQERWNFAGADLSSDKGLDTFLDLLRQSKESGCTHILLSEGRWLHAPDDPAYLARVAKARDVAQANQLSIVPCIYAFGYSGRYLALDRNLAAGLPVRDMPFVVRGRTATSDPALAVNVAGVKAENGGMSGRIDVRPFTHYRVSFSSPTELTGDPDEWLRFTSANNTRWVTRRNPDSRREGGRVRYETTFNSLECDALNMHIAAVVQDLKIEPAGLLMVIRRSLCPLRVADGDGRTVYEEGRDFEPVRDPKLATNGESIFAHEAPAIYLTANSRIQDGDKLRVSFFHAYRVGADQEGISLEDPKVFQIMDQDAANCANVWHADGYFMNYDEIRIAGWETPDRKPGEILAAHVRKGYDIIRKYTPQAKVYTWSDMFTPFHNASPFAAKGNYYLVHGVWDRSWAGLPKDVIIMNWYSPDKAAVRFFADRGHSQVICGYYDADTTEGMKSNITGWLKVISGVPNIRGFMYTTWCKNYKNMKEYFGLLDAIKP